MPPTVTIMGGDGVTTLGPAELIKFSGYSGATPEFARTIKVGESNSMTKTSSDGVLDDGGLLPNVAYVDATHWATKEVNAGGVSTLLAANSPTQAQSTFQITVSDAVAFECNQRRLFVYDGTTPSNPAVGLNCFGIKHGDLTWANCAGSGNPLDFGDSAAATTHVSYASLSVSPTTNGVKSATLRWQYEYV